MSAIVIGCGPRVPGASSSRLFRRSYHAPQGLIPVSFFVLATLLLDVSAPPTLGDFFSACHK